VSLRQLPADLGRLLHRVRTGGIHLSIDHRGVDALRGEIDRGSGRIAVALVALGLYVAASLLMQHSVGPRWGETPLLALFGYAAALGLTWRLVRDCWKTRGPTG
jgi:ubiquinone biosynthesis protein